MTLQQLIYVIGGAALGYMLFRGYKRQSEFAEQIDKQDLGKKKTNATISAIPFFSFYTHHPQVFREPEWGNGKKKKGYRQRFLPANTG
jgi:hypothetical protein